MPPTDGTAVGKRIHFEDVSVAYGPTTILEHFNLTVDPGEIVALLGPSGSGKTTALRSVAGFVMPTAGKVFIGERDVTFLPPYERNIGMVVQNYALFPHMSVAENVAFGLRARRAAQALVTERVRESLAMVGMSAYAERMPRALSGGQQQRVAIARALAIRPTVLLLDEPLSALDAQIRRSMVEEIARLHRQLPELTILYVTHDQNEALTLADRIAIMKDGKLTAFDTARALYRRPPNRFSAEFLGRANVLNGLVGAPAGDGLLEITVDGVLLRGVAPRNIRSGVEALICIRPHHLVPATPDEAANRITGRVVHVDWQGEVETLTLAFGQSTVRVATRPGAQSVTPGTDLSVMFDPHDATILPLEADHV